MKRGARLDTYTEAEALNNGFDYKTTPELDD